MTQHGRFLLVIMVIGFGTLIGSALLVWHGVRFQEDAKLETALAAARTYSDSISAFRKFYISEVAPTDLELDLLQAESPHSRLGRLTDPYSKSINLAEESLSEVGHGRYRVISDFPWNLRPDYAGVSEIEQRILDALTPGLLTEFVEIADTDRGRRLYLGTPITMEGSCVRCHNNHPQSPATNWKIGDVRGVQTVEVLIPGSTAGLGAMYSSFSTFWGGFAALFAAAFLLAVVFGRQTFRQMQESTAQGILDSLGEAVVGVDDKDMIVSSNSAAQQLFGYRDLHFPKKSLFDLISGQPVQNGDNSGPIEGEGRRSDGTTFACSYLVRPDQNQPGKRRVVSIRDITEEKGIREKLAQSNQMGTIGRLASGIAHEFNNLLAVIGASAEVAKEVSLGAQTTSNRREVKESLDNVIGASRKGTSLVRSLVSTASSRAQSPELREVVAFFAQLKPTLDSLLESRVALQMTATKKTSFYADPRATEDAIIAVASSVKRHLLDGEVLSIRVSEVQSVVEIRFSARIATADKGVGDLGNLDATEWDQNLDLTAVRNLVQQMGGEFCIVSDEDYSFCTSLFLPKSPKGHH